MDSRPALITVIASIAVISLVAYFTVDMTDRLEKERVKKEAEAESKKPLPVDPDKTEKKIPDPVVKKDPDKKDEPVKKVQDPEPEPEPMPKFEVAPVDGEPELPMTNAEAKKKGFMILPRGGFTFDVKVDGRDMTGVGVPAMIIMRQGLIEFFAAGEGSGKDHETIVRLECDIMELDLAMQMAKPRLTRGQIPVQIGDPMTPQGSRVLAFVRWKQGDTFVTHRAEDLIIDVRRRITMPRVGWTYVGDWLSVESAADPGQKKAQVLSAAYSRLLLSTWRNPMSLFDNPLPDARDPDRYYANHDVLPDSGTEVLVFFRPATAKEYKSIVEIEKKHDR